MNMIAAIIGAAVAAADPHVAQKIAERVQAFYQRTNDFTCRFDQEYTSAAMGSKMQSHGTLQVKKPGRMRWVYEAPTKKELVIEGERLFQYSPEDNQVTVMKHFSPETYGAGLSFLWGRGNLAKDFDVAVAERGDLPKGADALKLMPRGPAQFREIYFAVERDGRVSATIVFDTMGNENRMLFREMKTNVGIADKEFKFVTPKGAAVNELP